MTTRTTDLDDTNTVDLSYIADVGRLFERQWDAWVLAGLHGGPRRHNDLERTILARTGVRLDPTQLRRGLTHCRETGLIESVKINRDRFYRLTSRGMTDATLIVGIVADLRRRLDGDTPNTDRP